MGAPAGGAAPGTVEGTVQAMKTWIGRWLKVYEGEFGLFLWAAALLFFIRGSNIVLNNFVETAFLKRFGVEYLPLITGINAVVTFVVFAALAPVLRRVRGDRALARTLVACGVGIGAFRFVVPLGLDLLYPTLYVCKTQIDVLLAYLFWNLANDLFSTRQSKRLFPLITTGGIVGGVVGSFATPLVAGLLSSDNLLLFYPVLAVLAAGSVWRLGAVAPTATLKKGSTAPEEPGKPVVGELGKVLPLLRRSPLAQALLLLTLLPNVIVPILNFQFSFAVDLSFPTEAGMLGFYSYFRGAQNIIALVLSLFVGRLYGRFGLPVALMFHPANYLLTFGAFLVQFNLFSAVYAGVSVGVIRNTINNPATAALYGLLAPGERGVLRPFLRGTVVRVGILAGSVVVWLGERLFHPRYLSVVAGAVAAAWLAGVVRLRRQYPRILLDVLRGELPDFYRLDQRELDGLFRGVDVGPVLLERFRSSAGEECVWYAGVLRSNGAPELDDAILSKLPEVDDDTRIRLLDHLSDRAGARAMDAFLGLLDPSKPALMVALARTAKRVFADMPPEQERRVFASASMPEVKACFLRWMRQDEPDRFRALVHGWLASPDPSERRAGILALGELGGRDDVPALYQALAAETDPAALALALRALARIGAPDRGGRVTPYLHHPDARVRAAAVDALEPESEDAVRALVRTMGDPDDRVRELAIQRLEGVPERLRGPLVEAMGTHSRRIRDGLFRVARTLDLKDVDVFRFCRGQLTEAYQVLARAVALEQVPDGPARRLLQEHLEQVRAERVDNAVRGLAARDPAGHLQVILRGLRSGGARERADSIEALESVLDRPLARILMPMLETRTPAERLAVGRRFLGVAPLAGENGLLEAVCALLDAPDWVTNALTLELLAEWGRADLCRDRVGALRSSDNPAVAAAAAHAWTGQKEDGVDPTMDLPERIFHLRKVGLFRDLQVAELAAIATVAEETSLPADAVALSPDLPYKGLQVVVAGEVAVEQARPNSPCGVVELARWRSGHSFGEVTLFGFTPPEVTVRTLAPTRFLRIDRDEFYAIAKEYPEIALRVCEVLSERLGMVLGRLSQVSQCEDGDGWRAEQ